VRPARILVVLILLTALLVGCGSKPLGASEYRTRAIAICIAEKRRSEQVPEPRTPSDVPAFVAQGLRLVKPAVAKLAALRPPESLRPDHDRAVDLLNRQLALISDANAKLRARAEPLATFAALEPKLRPLMRAEDERWGALGLPQCRHQ